ncbi:MAG: dUTP pyrophosphatase [Candidatus Paceibacteria bacterium]|jgi:dUTP pyrophosphatase
MDVKFKKLYPEAKAPTYATDDDAGMDFYALEDTTILPMERKLVRTGIAMEIPKGYVGLVWDKSGVSYKKGQIKTSGVLDSGYRGEINIVMINITGESYTFEKHDKVAQMLIQEKVTANLIEVDELSGSERGEGGFGSTGHK